MSSIPTTRRAPREYRTAGMSYPTARENCYTWEQRTAIASEGVCTGASGGSVREIPGSPAPRAAALRPLSYLLKSPRSLQRTGWGVHSCIVCTCVRNMGAPFPPIPRHSAVPTNPVMPPWRLSCRAERGGGERRSSTTLRDGKIGAQPRVAAALRPRPVQQVSRVGGAGVARAWRGRGAGMSCDPREKRKRARAGRGQGRFSLEPWSLNDAAGPPRVPGSFGAWPAPPDLRGSPEPLMIPGTLGDPAPPARASGLLALAVADVAHAGGAGGRQRRRGGAWCLRRRLRRRVGRKGCGAAHRQLTYPPGRAECVAVPRPSVRYSKVPDSVTFPGVRFCHVFEFFGLEMQSVTLTGTFPSSPKIHAPGSAVSWRDRHATTLLRPHVNRVFWPGHNKGWRTVVHSRIRAGNTLVRNALGMGWNGASKQKPEYMRLAGYRSMERSLAPLRRPGLTAPGACEARPPPPLDLPNSRMHRTTLLRKPDLASLRGSPEAPAAPPKPRAPVHAAWKRHNFISTSGVAAPIPDRSVPTGRHRA
eukprot:gene11390-biopygen10906